jgi:uncharacterized membrane protein
MNEWLIWIAEQVIIAITGIALLVIVIGTIQAVVGTVGAVFSPLPEDRYHAAWIRYARWLTGGLTFLLAADIIETSISTDWETIGRVAAIAVIRTFLNYFLERDVAEMREG